MAGFQVGIAELVVEVQAACGMIFDFQRTGALQFRRIGTGDDLQHQVSRRCALSPN
jgi:hypothetical protein